MTKKDIEDHNALCAELTAGDGIPRLTWEQHGAAFSGPVALPSPGQTVAAWDSATPGTVGECRDGRYDVTFQNIDGVCRYPASQLRIWPEQIAVRS